MPKIIPNCPKRPPQAGEKGEFSHEISLLTPLFGGGWKAGEADPGMPFRATAIRGQLQFWWRATVGANCENAEELWQKHAETWGCTGKASPVKIMVENVQAGTPKPCGKYTSSEPGKWGFVPDNSLEQPGIKYAFFPFVGKPPDRGENTPQVEPAAFLPDGSFTLRVICPPAMLNDVRTAVRTWVNFGGLGARTRRGCGSIYCKDLAPASAAEAASLLKALLPNPPKAPREWPTLRGPPLAGKEAPPLVAWDSAMAALHKFRQGRNFARNPGRNGRPGRSRWPEPETIRQIAENRSAEHSLMENIPQDAFPRAELGLPIIFHFKDRRSGDPADTELYPYVNETKRDRMASPLIIKALGLQNGNALPIVLRLHTPPLENVVLEGEEVVPGGRETIYGADNLRGEKLAGYHNSPMKGTASGSALEAFINFIQDEDVWGILD